MLLKLKNRQRGFSLLEALLAIVIILAAGLGVVELFISADKKNKLQTTEQIIQQTSSAVAQFLSTSYTDTLTTAAIIDSGTMPKNAVSNGKIYTPYGELTLTPNGSNRNQYTISLAAVTGEQAMSLCQDMYTSTAVTVAGSGTPIDDIATCQSTFKAKTSSAIYFGFPKDAFYTSTTPS